MKKLVTYLLVLFFLFSSVSGLDIENNIPLEINSYEIDNIFNYIECQDEDIKTCWVNINGKFKGFKNGNTSYFYNDPTNYASTSFDAEVLTTNYDLNENIYQVKQTISMDLKRLTGRRLILTYDDFTTYNSYVEFTPATTSAITYTYTNPNPEKKVINVKLYIRERDSSSYTARQIDSFLYNFYTTFEDNTSSYQDVNVTFDYNGEQQYTIFASNSTNTINESGTILVNPIGTLNFLNQTGELISSDFYIDGVLATNPYNFTYYNDGYSLGLNTIFFEGVGFGSQNLNFTLSSTGTLNQNFNLQTSKIVVSIYDRETGNLITDDVDLTLIATTGYQTTTNTGKINISDINFIDEQYQLIADSLNYATETVYFNFNNQEVLDIEVHMLDLNATDYGFINIITVADTGQFVNNAVCQAMEWIPSSSAFLTRSEGLTNTQGQTSLNIEIGTKSYKFRCSKDGYSVDSNSQIISTSGETVTLVLSIGAITPEPEFENVNFQLYNVTYNSTHQRIFFDWLDNDGTIRNVCLKQYKLGSINKILINQSCSTSSSGQVQLLANVNQTYNIIFEAYIQDSKMDSLTFLGSESFAFNLKNYHLDIFLPIIFIILGISAGFFIQPQNIYISIMMVMVGTTLSVFIVPSIISFSIATFIWVICGFLIWGGSRQ